MSEIPEVDYDAEAVFFEGAWYTRADLAARIRAMIDAGDYRVARPSAALERLESALAGARVLALRVPPGLAEQVELAAVQAGRSPASVVREAIGAWLESNASRSAEGIAALEDPELEQRLYAR